MTEEFDLTDRNTIFDRFPRGGIGAEVGVGTGGFSAVILLRAKPSLLYLVDCWELQSVEVYGNDPANSRHDEKYLGVLKRFLPDERVHVVKAFSTTVAEMMPAEYFDWVYLDANHLRCREDIDAWLPRVKSGGYLMGHDYCAEGEFFPVKRDVDQWIAETGLTLLVTDDPVYKNWVVRKP